MYVGEGRVGPGVGEASALDGGAAFLSDPVGNVRGVAGPASGTTPNRGGAVAGGDAPAATGEIGVRTGSRDGPGAEAGPFSAGRETASAGGRGGATAIS